MAYRPNYLAANVLATCVLVFSIVYAVVAGTSPTAGGTELAAPFSLALVWLAPLFPALFLVGARVGSRVLMTFAFAMYLVASIWLAAEAGALAPTLAAAFLGVALLVGWISARSGPLSGVSIGPTPP